MWVRARDLGVAPLLRHAAAAGAAPVLGSLVGLAFAFPNPGGVRLFVGLIALACAGVLGSYVLHELAHLAYLRRLADLRVRVCWEVRWWRVSLLVDGAVSPRDSAAAAAAGPLGALLAGTVLLAASRQAPVSGTPWLPGRGWVEAIGWCYAAHSVFLLPVFPDGRAVLGYLRGLWGGS